MTTVSDSNHLTAQEREADLELDQLKQLVGLVPYDETTDVFPVTGWDAIHFVVGNATQATHYYQSAFGMELVGYSGPETGNRDHKAFVLKSGSIRFVIKGGVDPESPLHDHVRRHGDGVDDISFCRLTGTDVVRHRLVGRIVEAYEAFDIAQEEADAARDADRRAEAERRAAERDR